MSNLNWELIHQTWAELRDALQVAESEFEADQIQDAMIQLERLARLNGVTFKHDGIMKGEG